MKKGIFLPILALVVIVSIGILGMIFYKDYISDKEAVVGEKAAEVVNSITESELDLFYIEDAARLAWYNSLERLAEDTGVSCLYDEEYGTYPVWDISIAPTHPSCSPLNYINSFESYFREDFDEFLKENDLSFNYEFEYEGDMLKLKPLSKIISKNNFGKLSVEYDLNPLLGIKIKSNFDDYEDLIGCAYQTSSEREKCFNEMNVDLVESMEDIKLYNYDSEIESASLEKVGIKFAIAENPDDFYVEKETEEYKETLQAPELQSYGGLYYPVTLENFKRDSRNWGNRRYSSGNYRCHAGDDIYTKGNGEVISITEGVVVNIYPFITCKVGGSGRGGPTVAVIVDHGDFTVNYGEINLGDVEVNIGDEISAGQLIGKAQNCGMLHLEVYSEDVNKNLRWWPNSAISATKNICALEKLDKKPSSLKNPMLFLDGIKENKIILEDSLYTQEPVS